MYGLLFLCAPRVHAGEVLDGVLASVNGHVILQSDLDEELRYENLMSGHEQQGTNEDDRKKVLDRLVDRELLTEQVSTTEFAPTTADEIERGRQLFFGERPLKYGSYACSTCHAIQGSEILNAGCAHCPY